MGLNFLQDTVVSLRTNTFGVLQLAQVCLVLVMMKTNCNKKNSEQILAVTVRVVKCWNRGPGKL